MALLNQNFTKFDYDTFNIRFTITDANTDLSSGWFAWWGVSSAATDSSYVIEKASAGWTSPGPTGGSSSEIELGTSSVTVKLGQSDFGVGNLQPDTIYYHELVLSDTSDGSDSVVVASGDFTVNPSLFTNNSYRP